MINKFDIKIKLLQMEACSLALLQLTSFFSQFLDRGTRYLHNQGSDGGLLLHR